ncbi:MAG: D-alanyl-D-alanine carboxypeptidase [Rhodospirillales bacterium]|nr:D-alanyl-D-alanine carboxypeptidase [Rhodospirillales bacterium]
MIRRFLIPCLAVLLFAANMAQAFDTGAREAILIDEMTGTVLLSKNAQAITYPSSMTKLMTVYMLFERLADETLSLGDTLAVSEKAWRMGGSKMFVEVGTSVRVEDLIRGIVVQSGNDATIVVAEALAGSEDAFARDMTDKARELGMNSTIFRNASGWPDPEHVTTIEDISILVRRTIEDFPQYYHYYAETEFTFSEITQSNRNPLLYAGIGADGLKTGHTEAAGFGLAASAIQGDRRLILVINGLKTSQDRAFEAQRILEWGFREFDTYNLFASGEAVIEADVWLGDVDTVPLVLDEDLEITLSRTARRDMEVKIVYDGPIPAPIQAGTPVASLIVEAPAMPTIKRTLLAGADVGELSFISRLGAAVSFLIFGPPASP